MRDTAGDQESRWMEKELLMDEVARLPNATCDERATDFT